MKSKHPTSNIQHPTSNDVAGLNDGSGQNRKFELEERFLEFASGIVDLSEKLPNSRAGIHVAGQNLHSGTASFFPTLGEAGLVAEIFYR